MDAAGQALLISVIIRAIDGASPILRALGISGASGLNPLVTGAAVVAAAIGGIGIMAAKAANDFDYNMQKIAALTNTSADQMQSYKQQLLAMAPAIDQTPADLAKGLYFVISAGYSGADALNILKLSAQAAASTMTPMQSVADLLTTAMNAYRGSNVSAGHAMDDLINTVVQGKVTMSSLATSMGFVLVTAKAAGLNIDQASAAVSTLSQVAGEHGSRRVMMDLDNSLRMVGIETEKVSAKAEKMKGLKAPWDAAAFAAMNYMQKLQYIAQETGGVGYLDKTQAAAYEATGNMQNLAQATAHANTNFMTLVGGAAAFIPSAMLLSDKGAMYNQILKTMGTNGQETAKSFDIMRQSTGQQLQMLQKTGLTLLTVLGEHLLPVLSQILTGLTGLGRSAIAFAQSGPGIEAIKTALIGIAAVVGGILATTVGGLVATAAPLIAVIAAIVFIGIKLGPVIQQIIAHFGGWQGILKSLHPLLQTIGTLFAQAGDAIKKAFADPAIQAAWKQLQAALPGLLPLLKAIGIVLGVSLFLGFKLVEGVILLVIKALPLLITIAAGVLTVLGKIGDFLMALFSGKVFKAVGDGLHKLGTLVAARFNEIKAWALMHLMMLVVGVGSFFSEIGTKVHNGIETVKRVIQQGFAFVGGLFVWLYHHNIYIQRGVDFIREQFTRAKVFLMAVVVGIRAFIATKWQEIQNDARQAWSWVYQHIVAPVQQVWTLVTSKVGQLKDWLVGIWSLVVRDAGTMWNNFVGKIIGIATTIRTAVQDHVITPITTAVQNLISDALTWGTNLIKMFVQGILSQAGNVKNAAGSILSHVSGFLGFHSPAPNVPESAYWGRNLVTMFGQSMLTGMPQLLLATAQVMRGVQQQMNGRATAGVGVAGAGGALGGAGLALAGGGAGGALGGAGSVTYNLNFPNATSRTEIVAAIRQVQQSDSRAGRRPGMYGGLGAHTTRQ